MCKSLGHLKHISLMSTYIDLQPTNAPNQTEPERTVNYDKLNYDRHIFTLIIDGGPHSFKKL